MLRSPSSSPVPLAPQRKTAQHPTNPAPASATAGAWRQVRSGFGTRDHCRSEPKSKVCGFLPRAAPASPGPSHRDRARTHPAQLLQDQPQGRRRGRPGPLHGAKVAPAGAAAARPGRATTGGREGEAFRPEPRPAPGNRSGPLRSRLRGAADGTAPPGLTGPRGPPGASDPTFRFPFRRSQGPSPPRTRPRPALPRQLDPPVWFGLGRGGGAGPRGRGKFPLRIRASFVDVSWSFALKGAGAPPREATPPPPSEVERPRAERAGCGPPRPEDQDYGLSRLIGLPRWRRGFSGRLVGAAPGVSDPLTPASPPAPAPPPAAPPEPAGGAPREPSRLRPRGPCRRPRSGPKMACRARARAACQPRLDSGLWTLDWKASRGSRGRAGFDLCGAGGHRPGRGLRRLRLTHPGPALHDCLHLLAPRVTQRLMQPGATWPGACCSP